MSGTSSIPSIVSPCRIGTVNGGEGRTKREVDKIDVKRERERGEGDVQGGKEGGKER